MTAIDWEVHTFSVVPRTQAELETPTPILSLAFRGSAGIVNSGRKGLKERDASLHSCEYNNCNHYLCIHTTTYTTVHTPFACCRPLFETDWVGSAHQTPYSHCSTCYKMVSLEVDTPWGGLLPQGVWARYTLCHRWKLTSKHMHQLVVLTLYKTDHSTEDTQDSKEAWPIPSQPHGRKRHSTQLTFTDGWTPLCSNFSSTHNSSRAGNTHSLYTSFTSWQGTSDYSLGWRLVLQGTLWGSLSQRMLTWGQAGAGVEAGGLWAQKAK